MNNIKISLHSTKNVLMQKIWNNELMEMLGHVKSGTCSPEDRNELVNKKPWFQQKEVYHLSPILT